MQASITVKEDKPVLNSVVQELNEQLDDISSGITYNAQCISKIHVFSPITENEQGSPVRENDLVSMLAVMADRLKLYNQRLVAINKHLNGTI